MSLVDNNLPAPGTTNTPPPNQPPSPPAASAVAAASGGGGGLLSRGAPPAASGGSGVIPSAASGGGPTTLPGLGTWQGTGWSNPGYNGGNQPGDNSGMGAQGGASPAFGGDTVGGGAAFDDGGSVDDGSGGAPSLDDALSTIKDTLNYGRQQAGMGQQANAAPQAQSAQGGVLPSKPNDPNDPSDETYQENIDDQSPGNVTTGPAMSMYGLSGAAQGMSNARKMMGFADGGDVDDPSAAGTPPQPQANQPTPQPGGLQQNNQPPPKLAGYVMGAGAVPPDMARALEARVDPQGTMDPTTRKMLAIQAAPDQQTQWGLMQNYRQQFNAHTAFARAAAAGTPQKPADMAAAAKAATDAFSNVPDGTQTTFQPTQGGVVAHIHHLAGGGKTVQGHDDGGPAMGDSGVSDTGDTSGGDQSQQDASIPLSAQQFQAVLAKMPYDAVMDGGAAQTFQKIASAEQPDQGDVTGSIRGGGGGPQTTAAGRALRGNTPITPIKGGQQIAQNNNNDLPDNGVGITATLRGTPTEGTTSVNPKTGARTYVPGPPASTISVSPHYPGAKGNPAIDTASGLNQPGTAAGASAADAKGDAANDRAKLRADTQLQIAAMQAAERAKSSGMRTFASVQNDVRNNNPKMDPDDVNRVALQAMQSIQQGGGQQQGSSPFKGLMGYQGGAQPQQELRYDTQGNAYTRGPDGKPVRVNQ